MIADTGRGETFIEELLELMVRRHLVTLAAFLLQPHPPALAVGEIVLDRNDGADAREAVDHDANQRAVTEAHQPRHFGFRPVRQSDFLDDLYASGQLPGLLLSKDRRLATVHDMLGPAHRVRRVGGENLADDQPVEQHTDRGQVLLDCRSGGSALPYGSIAGLRHLQRLDIGSDMEGLDTTRSPMPCCSSQAKNEHTAR